MRYQQIDTISFTNIFGNSFAVKDMREYPDYSTQEEYPVKRNERLDEIISRPEYFGDDSEMDTYKLFEHNVVDMFESRFDLSKVKSLRIPVR